MELKVIVVLVSGLLGVLSCGAGFGAEVTRIKPADIEALSRTYCVYPESRAKILGIIAATTLLVAQIILNVASKCFCCQRSSHSIVHLRFLSVISWIAFLIAMRLFLAGTILNDGMVNGNEESYFGSFACYYVKPGVFAGGAIMSALSVMLGIQYYLKAIKDRASENTSGVEQVEIPMAQPQFPQQYNNSNYNNKDHYPPTTFSQQP